MSEWPDQSAPIYEQSAVVPFRMDCRSLEVALITSRSGKRWVIPKGLIDPGETPEESAVREAVEEAGLIGDLSESPIGHYNYEKWGGVCEVDVYALSVTRILDDWEESWFRTREWMSPEEAARRVRELDLKAILLDLPQLVDGV
jgi:phosphohistidine phosphatase